MATKTRWSPPRPGPGCRGRATGPSSAPPSRRRRSRSPRRAGASRPARRPSGGARLLAASCSRGAPRARARGRRLVRSAAASRRGAPTSAREGAGARLAASRGARPAPSGSRSAASPRLEVGAVLGQLGLGDLGRLRHLGVVLGARSGSGRRSPCARGCCASRARRSAFRCARVFATAPARSAGLLVGVWRPHQRQYLRISIRSGRVAPRLVGLVVAPLALLAGERDGDSDVSAGHVSSDSSKAASGVKRLRPDRKKPPGTRGEVERRIAPRDNGSGAPGRASWR